MEEVKKIATRESFGKALEELENENIVVLDADLDTSTKTEYFKQKHPKRFIELGIAESDMVGTAAGLATCGKIPFAATFAVFMAGRCYDQIRTSIAYPNLNVKLCGTHAGITVGEDGATHQMLEDIGLMRGLPNMTVISPSDDVQTRNLVKKIAEFDGPVYLRLSRQKTETLYKESQEFEIGKAVELTVGNNANITIFATGVTVSEAVKAMKNLKKDGIEVRVIDMHTIKPIDTEMIKKCALNSDLLISVEDHSIIGGLGSAISDVLTSLDDVKQNDSKKKKGITKSKKSEESKDYCRKLIRLGIQDTFGKSGKPESLMRYFKIDCEAIENEIKDALLLMQ